ncbi:hypothetical protein F4780DRAFT_87539 [Xylariomycetidae sp. FL0641]|nr:hypothetical protein F4780DRAFT_87539 [Xylariomycetidae sp. FL0641]
MSDDDSDEYIGAERTPRQHRRPRSANATSASIYASTSPRASRASGHDTKHSSQSFRSSITATRPGPDRTPQSTSHHTVHYKSPKIQTPKDTDWTAEKIEAELRRYSEEIGQNHAKLTVRLIHDAWKKQAPERHFVSTKDWFASMKREPIEGGTKSADTMRIKTKQLGQGKSVKQEKREYYQVICIKTNREPTPAYSFHHVEIRKNILSPNSMLTFVPHLRDLTEREESQYRSWLRTLENLDKESGFDTANRQQKVANTIQKERAATLLEYLDDWLETLNIEHCTRTTLIRYMASQPTAVTPQQKSSILSSYTNNYGSPRSAKAVKLFTVAFDRVFNSKDLREQAVPLQDVLLQDRSVDTIVDSKKWMKDTPGQARIAEEQMSVETFLETYALLGCMICGIHSCEHGEYGRDNERKRFSVAEIGGLGKLIERQQQLRLQHARPRDDDHPPFHGRKGCGPDCHVHGKKGTRARAWSEAETMLLKTFYANFTRTSIAVSCATAVATGRPCWDVQRQIDKMDLDADLPLSPPPPAVYAKPLPWYDRKKKTLLGDWQEQTNTHEHGRKNYFDPCGHDGPCDGTCPCVKARVLCERFCRCTAETCARKFTGCACHSLGQACVAKQKDRPCICVQLNRECDPVLCGSCGAHERAMPQNAGNDSLHATGCQNCALQRGKSKSVILGKSRIAGYGLFTTEDIAQDEFVIEYVGELISHDEGVRREARRGNVFDEKSNTSYLFTLLEEEGIWVDAAIYGNLSRYINHQEANCNLTPRIMYANGEYRIMFTSLRDIKAGEELSFNYGKNFLNLPQELMQNESAEKKRAAKEQPATGQDGEKIRKNPGRKPGRKPGSKPGNKPGRKPGKIGRPPKKPGRKPGRKPKTPAPLAKVESEAEDDELIQEPPEGSAAAVDIPNPRKRKRKGHADDGSDSGEYQPGIADSYDDTQTSALPSRSQSRRRKGVKSRDQNAAEEGPSSGGFDGAFERRRTDSQELDTTPRRRGRKSRKITDDAWAEAIIEDPELASPPVVTPKKRGRKPKYLTQKASATKSVEESEPPMSGSLRSGGSSRFRHTQARLEPNGVPAVEEATPTRGRPRRQVERSSSSAESSPLSFLGSSDSESSNPPQRPCYRRNTGRNKKSSSADDEYDGNSWEDSHGGRHHGAVGDTDDDDDDEDDEDAAPVTRRRRRQRPARYND